MVLKILVKNPKNGINSTISLVFLLFVERNLLFWALECVSFILQGDVRPILFTYDYKNNNIDEQFKIVYIYVALLEAQKIKTKI